jgi:hypothetical protein
MAPGDPVSKASPIVERAKSILLKPKDEWPVIAGEVTTIKNLFTGYAMILAAIPAVCGLIGAQLFGYGFMGFSYKPPLVASISMAIVSYVLSLAALFVLALIIDYLAPTFGGTKDKVSAFKVAVYSGTAGWLAGIFSLIPSLAILGLVGLYSLYLLYTGLPVLMKAPAEKALPYTVVTVVAGAVLFFLIGLLSAPIMAAFGGGYPGSLARSSAAGGTVEVPGMGKIDLDKLNDATRKMEASAVQMEQAAKTTAGAAGASVTVAPDALQAMLPASIGSYRRTEVSSASLGVGGAHAEGKYANGDRNIDIEITDMAAAGALAGIGAAMGVQSSRQTETGYEKTSTAGNRIITENWDKSGDGTFSTTIANRFMVQASGQVASIDELKAAVAAVGLNKLETMAK